MGLLRIIRHCLGTELKLVQQAENVIVSSKLLVLALGIIRMSLVLQMTLGMASNQTTILPDTSTEILQQLEILRQRTQETGEDLRRMEQEQEAFALEYHEMSKIQANLNHLQTQPQSPQRAEFEKQLRVKKDLSEQKLNQKVIICAFFFVVKP